MDEIKPKSWVWRSTKASRAAGVVSVLAVAETLACVAAYWALIWVWGVTWHHWIILIAAPMVLLRSPQSIALGVKWFEGYWKEQRLPKKPTAKTLLTFAVSTWLTAISGALLVSDHTITQIKWVIWIGTSLPDFLRVFFPFFTFFLMAITTVLGRAEYFVGAYFGVIFGSSIGAMYVFGVGSGAIASISVLLSCQFLMFFGHVCGILLRAFFTRACATIVYLRSGVQKLPNNWIEAVITADLFDTVYLVPEHEETAYGKIGMFPICYAGGTPVILIGFNYPQVQFAFLILVVLWRWAIKSTAWLYFPPISAVLWRARLHRP